VIRPLLEAGHHLVTRARINTVAYLPIESDDRRRPGRPRLYGDKIRLRDLIAEDSLMHAAPSPIAGEAHVTIRCCAASITYPYPSQNLGGRCFSVRLEDLP
jgi:hypothetical protein